MYQTKNIISFFPHTIGDIWFIFIQSDSFLPFPLHKAVTSQEISCDLIWGIGIITWLFFVAQFWKRGLNSLVYDIFDSLEVFIARKMAVCLVLSYVFLSLDCSINCNKFWILMFFYYQFWSPPLPFQICLQKKYYITIILVLSVHR